MRLLTAPGLSVAPAQHQRSQPAHIRVGTLGQNLFIECVALLVAQAGDLQQDTTGQVRVRPPRLLTAQTAATAAAESLRA